MASSVGKRQREQQKLEKARAKGERRAARLAAQVEQEDVFVSPRSESELMEDLGHLQRAFEAGEVSDEGFEKRRQEIQAQLERLLR